MIADVLVVGGGPSGSATAIGLARRGLDVVVLDACQFPRSKPCGDAISPGALPLLEELGARDAVRATPCGFVDGWRIRSPNGNWFESRFDPRRTTSPRRGLCVDRALLDNVLIEAARDAGAEIREQVRVFDLLHEGGRIGGVRVRGPDGAERTLRGRFVVGADGLRSRVARRLGPVTRGRRRRLALVGRWRGATGPTGVGEMRISPEGVLGFASLGDDVVNITIVVPIEHAPAIGSDPLPFFLERTKRYGLAHRLEGASLTRPIEVTGPFEITPRRRTAPGALLVGDAAGYLDPFTGQGVFRALDGARLAVPAIHRSLRDGGTTSALAEYEHRLDRHLRTSRALQRGIDFVVSRASRIDRAAGLLRTRPGLASWLADMTGDRVGRRAYA